MNCGKYYNKFITFISLFFILKKYYEETKIYA